MARPVEYTKEELIEILKNIGETNLSKRSLDKRKDLPSAATIIRKFGSWSKALEEVSLSQGIRTGRKPNNKDFKIGNKTFSLNNIYSDDYIFFSKEEIYNYHKVNSEDKCLNELVIPFVKFLHQYVEKYGWIFPTKTTKKEWEELIFKLKKMEGNLSSSTRSGNSEIKNYFYSFWDSYLGCFGASPIDLFYDEKLLIRFLKYRFGISDGKKYKYIFNNEEIECPELFNISFKQVRRAFEVNHYTISVFKPLLAKWVYRKYGFDGMLTWDPCAGFAGRGLGFVSSFENGKYVGTEPNTKLYNEFEFLIEDLKLKNRIELINLPMEDFDICDVDLVFTCPPYFNTEVYCKEETQSSVKYLDKESWDSGFLKPLLVKSYAALKNGGKCIIMFDGKNASLCQSIAISVGFRFVEILIIENKKTHLTKKTNYEFVVVFEK